MFYEKSIYRADGKLVPASEFEPPRHPWSAAARRVAKVCPPSSAALGYAEHMVEASYACAYTSLSGVLHDAPRDAESMILVQSLCLYFKNPPP